MSRLENAVLGLVHILCFFLSRFSPKQKHNIVALTVDHLYHMVCEFLPSTFSMRIWFAVLHCQRSVKQENSLLGPLCKVSMGWNLRNVFERNEVFVDVFKGRGRRHWL